MGKNRRFILVTLVILAAWLAVYSAALRPWFLDWGATRDERTRTLPGQELAPVGAQPHTRAVTVDAPPDRVWPWLAQIGIGRAGFYSYTWLENLFLSGIHNVYRVAPLWQDRRAGDFVRSFQFGAEKAGVNGWRMEPFEDGKYFFLNPGWGPFVLEPRDASQTRFVIRSWRNKMNPAAGALMALFFDPIHFAMEKRTMTEVKRLAERRRLAPGWLTALAWIGFGLAGTIGAGIIVSRKRKKLWILVPDSWALLCLVIAGDPQAALTAFTASGLIIAGFRAFGRRGWAWLVGFWIFAYLVLIFANNAYLVFGLVFLAAAPLAFWALSKRRTPAMPAS